MWEESTPVVPRRPRCGMCTVNVVSCPSPPFMKCCLPPSAQTIVASSMRCFAAAPYVKGAYAGKACTVTVPVTGARGRRNAAERA